MKYVIVVVKDFKDKRPTMEFDDLKVEYVSIGEQFHGRHFKGKRPTHVIDYSGVPKWYEYFDGATKYAEMKISD